MTSQLGEMFGTAVFFSVWVLIMSVPVFAVLWAIKRLKGQSK